MRSVMLRIGFAGFAVVLCGQAIGAGPTVHRCIGDAGEVVFSQTVCGSSATPVQLSEPQVIGDGLRTSERAWLEQRASRPPRVSNSKTSTSNARDLKRRQREQYRCQRTRQQLDAVRAERRRGYKAGKGVKLRERQQRYETYLASFCS